jgi:hypothetical protein
MSSIDGPLLLFLPCLIYTCISAMGPKFGWAPGRRTYCPGPEPALHQSNQKIETSYVFEYPLHMRTGGDLHTVHIMFLHFVLS